MSLFCYCLFVFVSLFSFTALTGYTHELGSIAEILCLILMLVNGTLMGTIPYKIFIGSILLLGLGAIFRIMHYTGGEEMMVLSFILIPLTYTIHFICKKPKDQLDVLKTRLWMLVAGQQALKYQYLL